MADMMPIRKDIPASMIVHRLARHGNRHRRSTVMTNYTPLDWWECDVMEITKAQYFYEYEVKLSRADFFADKKKSCVTGCGKYDPEKKQWVLPPAVMKHDLLHKADPAGPSRFWFVTPMNLIRLDELPPWAGLIEMHTRPTWSAGAIAFEEMVCAPRLHKKKVDQKFLNSLLCNCYHRMHDLIVPRLHEQENQYAERCRLADQELPAGGRPMGDAGPGEGNGDRSFPSATDPLFGLNLPACPPQRDSAGRSKVSP